MDCKEVFFSSHAVQRMFERGIQTIDIRNILKYGEEIANYQNDKPFPSCLILGFVNERPVHVVVAFDEEDNRCYIVTAYIPDPRLWENGFKRRKRS